MLFTGWTVRKGENVTHGLQTKYRYLFLFIYLFLVFRWWKRAVSLVLILILCRLACSPLITPDPDHFALFSPPYFSILLVIFVRYELLSMFSSLSRSFSLSPPWFVSIFVKYPLLVLLTRKVHLPDSHWRYWIWFPQTPWQSQSPLSLDSLLTPITSFLSSWFGIATRSSSSPPFPAHVLLPRSPCIVPYC